MSMESSESFILFRLDYNQANQVNKTDRHAMIDINDDDKLLNSVLSSIIHMIIMFFVVKVIQGVHNIQRLRRVVTAQVLRHDRSHGRHDYFKVDKISQQLSASEV